MPGTFRVPDGPGPAPVAVPGPVRLALEAALFGLAVALLSDTVGVAAASVLGLAVVAHYLLA